MTQKFFVLVVDSVPAGDVVPQGDVRARDPGYQEVLVAPYPQDGKIYRIGPARIEGDVLVADWLDVPDLTYAQRIIVKSRLERENRDARIKAIEWRYARYSRNARTGAAQQDDIGKLDVYVQALADVPSQEGFPWQINWPIYTP